MADLPEPPYPASVRAKGWRFELDYEQIEQSGTWNAATALALEGLPLARPFLLAVWYAAWKQVPCGSLPADDMDLAGAIGLPRTVFAEYRDVLLRGWTKASDGRLYHPTLTARVVEMMDRRRSDADRKARNRSKSAQLPSESTLKPGESHASQADVTRDSDGSPAAVHRESTTDHLPPNTSSPSSKRKARERAPAVPTVAPDVLIAAGFDGDTAAEFIAHKDRAKAPLTERAWKDHCREADRAGWSPMQAAEKVMAKGWKGFEAKYVAGEPGPGARPPPMATESPITRSKREAHAQWGGGRVAAKAPAAQGEILEMTDGHR